MAEVNAIGAVGAVLSFVGVGTFWLWALLSYSVIGPGVDDLQRQMNALLGVLALVYTFGAMIGMVSQLGALLQLPSLAIALPVCWYHSHPIIYLFYSVSLLGATLLTVAMFIDYSRAEKSLGIPPFSRTRIWRVSSGGSRAGPLPKGVAKMILAVITAFAVAAAAFAAYAWSAEVSHLHIDVWLDGTVFGNSTIEISVDGTPVCEKYVDYDGSEYNILLVETTCEVSAGSHLVEVDAWNGSGLLEGTIDVKREAKVLPYTTEEMMLGLGVGFI